MSSSEHAVPEAGRFNRRGSMGWGIERRSSSRRSNYMVRRSSLDFLAPQSYTSCAPAAEEEPTYDNKAAQSPEKTSALLGRLENITVLQLHKDGSKEYLNLTSRGLYKHVIESITNIASMEQSMSLLRASNADPNTAFDAASTSIDRPDEAQFAGSISSSATGVVEEFVGRQTSHKDRIGAYLHPRDMRRLVTPFSSSNEPGIMVRRHCILMNFDPLRAVITRDRLLILVADNSDELVLKLEKRLRGGAAEIEDSIFGSEDLESFEGRSALKFKGFSPPGFEDQGRIDDNILVSSVKAIVEAGAMTASAGARTAVAGAQLAVKGTMKVVHDTTTGAKGLVQTIANTVVQSSSSAPAPVSRMQESVFTSRDFTELSEREEDVLDDLKHMHTEGYFDLPFELASVDCVLHSVCTMLADDTYSVQESAVGCIRDVVSPNSKIQDPLAAIGRIKNATREMEARIKGFNYSITKLLEDDECMALMNVSRLITHPHRFTKPVSAEELEVEADEPELILEGNMQLGMTLLNTLDQIHGQIDTASELVDQQLDASRNRILFANMLINVFTLCVTMGSFVGSMFGMNLTNFLESSPTAFRQIVLGTVGGMAGFLILLVNMLYVMGAMPRKGFAANN